MISDLDLASILREILESKGARNHDFVQFVVFFCNGIFFQGHANQAQTGLIDRTFVDFALIFEQIKGYVI